MNRRHGRVKTLALVTVLMAALVPNTNAGAAPTDLVPMTSSQFVTQPLLPSEVRPAAPLSPAEHANLTERLHQMREQMAAQVSPGTEKKKPPPAPAAPSLIAQPDDPGADFHGPPNAFIVGRNAAQPFATGNTCGTVVASPYEPATANEGPHAYYTSNLVAQQFTLNGGVTWQCAPAYPAGPAQAPTPFGDTDVIYDRSRGVTFHMVLYVNATLSDGVIGIFVRRNINLADNCFYFVDIDPAANVLPDYPKLALSNDWLYTNANRVGGGWQGAAIVRLNVDQVSDCVGATTQTVNFTNPGGQRILVPGHGARDVMYFSWVETATSWRIFSWADNPAAVVLQTVIGGVIAMTFADADCRGGTNNVDWSGPLNTSIVGFSVRTAIGDDFVTALTAVDRDPGGAPHPHAFIRGIVLRVGAAQNLLTLVQQPELWFTDRCTGLPNLGSNDRGDVGMVEAVGGAFGGGGPAVDTAVGMKDQFNPGPGGFSVTLTVGSTHNPSRYGDYFTVRRHSPDGNFFTASAFGYIGGTAVANTSARYVEFGRGRDHQGYLAWRNAIPAT
ncbi:MAG TPA: hypothetical protein VFC19_27260 [Candidatus Limnocylindrales bacterium]|nr:hypothetical protein [Candidatus Limnocylindrales bacterium]